MEETEEINKIKEELKGECKEVVKQRPPYLMPITKIIKAEQIMKVVRIGNGLGLALPRDVYVGMGIKRGTLLKINIELFPSDAEIWLSNESKIINPNVMIIQPDGTRRYKMSEK